MHVAAERNVENEARCSKRLQRQKFAE